MMDNLSDQARQTLDGARGIAVRLGHKQVTPGHLLVAALSVECDARTVLNGYGLTAPAAEATLASVVAAQPDRPGSAFSTETREIIKSAYHASRDSHTQADVTAFVRAMLLQPDESVTAVLKDVDLAPTTVLAALDAAAPPATGPTEADDEQDDEDDAQLVAAGSVFGPVAKQQAGDLTAFGTDMVEAARQGTISPVNGRLAELERVMTVIGRRTKNCPVLIGEPGVGKTAVVEGLALALAAGKVPAHLAGRPLVNLEIASLVAGTRYRGDFEQRLRKTLAAASATKAIVFIDEIHQIVGAGSAGGLDVANMLKEQMARGQLTIVGATTLDEYRKHIETDSALERRMAKILVEEPSVEATIDILTTLRAPLIAHHKVTFTRAALEAAAKLTDRHITDRRLPDKAIDALDEAGAAAAMTIMRTPAHVRDLYKRRTDVRLAQAKAVAAEDYTTAAQHTPADRELTAAIIAATGCDHGVVDAAHIATVLTNQTGIPVTTDADTVALTNLEAELSARVVGQDHAVKTVAAAVRRRRLLGAERPSAFIFAGPTGVGKSELAKALADVLFAGGAQGRGKLITLDMSEFASKHTVSRLVGPPPGYVGYDNGGELTEAVRRNPYAVLLLDEVEKAHVDVFDLLLQVLEDGRLTDSTGRVVDFKNVLIIMTSNLGAAAAARPAAGFTSGAADHVRTGAGELVTRAVKEHFRPEFLNRVEDVVVFDALARPTLEAILEPMLVRLRSQLADKGLTLELTPAAVGRLLQVGYDPAMGARPLRRTITRLLENPLSDALIAGMLPAGAHVLADAIDGQDELLVATAPDPVPVREVADALV